MAKSKLSLSEVRQIFRQYDLGLVEKFSYFPLGVEHTNLFVRTGRGRYVLRIYERGSRGFINFELKLLEKLKQHRFPSAYPLQTRSGKKLVFFAGKPAVVFPYVPGVHVRKPNLRQIGQIGSVLGKLHSLTRTFRPKESKFRYDAEVATIRKLAGALIKEGKKGKIKNIGLVERIIKEEFPRFVFPSNLPKGILHADLFEDNVKFYRGKIEGVLDFDDSFRGRLIDDLGTTIMIWCFSRNRLDLKKARVLVQNYQRERSLTRLEEKYLFLSLQFVCLKFGVYLLKRMHLWKEAKNKMFDKLLSLRSVSETEFRTVCLNYPKERGIKKKKC